LGSRTLSGILGEFFQWQNIFLIAAALMFLLMTALYKLLPEVEPDFKDSYVSLYKSIAVQFKTRPKLRLASYRGAINFAGFSIFWTTIVFLLEEPPFYM